MLSMFYITVYGPVQGSVKLFDLPCPFRSITNSPGLKLVAFMFLSHCIFDFSFDVSKLSLAYYKTPVDSVLFAKHNIFVIKFYFLIISFLSHKG